MYKELECTCITIVLLTKPFVLWRSRCRCRRGLLKVPITCSITCTITLDNYLDNVVVPLHSWNFKNFTPVRRFNSWHFGLYLNDYTVYENFIFKCLTGLEDAFPAGCR